MDRYPSVLTRNQLLVLLPLLFRTCLLLQVHQVSAEINYKLKSARSRVGDEVGYYTVDHYTTKTCDLGHYCENGTRIPCPAGKYGGKQGLSSSECLGNCSEGFYCPPGSTSAQEIICGDPSFFCPNGSSTPIKVDVGYYSVESARQAICEAGHFCKFGVKQTCPPGFFNPTEGMSSIEHCLISPEGYYAPRASVLPKECGSVDLFCPEGSPYPIKAAPGYYTTSSGVHIYSTVDDCSILQSNCTLIPNHSALHWHRPTVVNEEKTRSSQKLCEPGFYCPGNGQRYECEPGLYGSTYGLKHQSCSGICLAGYFCPAKSTKANQVMCGITYGAAVYCPEGSGSPFPVDSGYYTDVAPANYGTGLQNIKLRKLPTGEVTKPYPWITSNLENTIQSLVTDDFASKYASKQVICPRGHYCIDGIRYECAAGKYGGIEGLASPICSGFCYAGYYCPIASVTPTEKKCGSTEYYCPVASALPRMTPKGYYSVGNDNETRVTTAICEPGFFCVDGIRFTCEEGYYGKTYGLFTEKCSGECEPGYFCPPGSTHQKQYKCGDIVGLTEDANTFHENTDPSHCVTYMLPVWPEQFIEFALLDEVKNEHIDTTKWDISLSSPSGMTNKMVSWDSQHAAWKSDGSENSFIATWWKPDTGPKTFCMWKMFLTEYVYGIDGMEKVEGVNDYFMLGTFLSYRDRLFASSGENRGTYSKIPVMINKNEWVFYCLTSGGKYSSSAAYVATPADIAYGPTKVWEQDNNGNDKGVVGEGNGLGMVYGKGSKALYGGIINFNDYLSEDEIKGVYNVLARFYPGHGGLRKKNQMLCGWYNSNEWQQGHRGRHQGPQSSAHLEKRPDIDHNYYWKPTPPGLKQQSIGLGSMKWRLWYRDRYPKSKKTIDSIASSQQQELIGGGHSFYCPKNSGFPIHVKPGFFTAGSEDGMTQSTEYECPTGFYCYAGKKFPCYKGYFGNKKGLLSKECSGFCPAGYMCPEGCDTPVACELGTYAVVGSHKCSPCPTKEKATCTTSRKCCK